MSNRGGALFSLIAQFELMQYFQLTFSLLLIAIDLNIGRLVELTDARVLNIDIINNIITVKLIKTEKIRLLRITSETKVFDEHYLPSREIVVGDVISGVLRPKREGAYSAIRLFIRLTSEPSAEELSSRCFPKGALLHLAR